MADQGSLRRRGLHLSSTTFSVPDCSPTLDRKAVGKSQLVVNNPPGFRGIESHPRKSELCGELECGGHDRFPATFSPAFRMDENHAKPSPLFQIGHDCCRGDDFPGSSHQQAAIRKIFQKPEPILLQLVPARQSAEVEQRPGVGGCRAGNVARCSALSVRHGHHQRQRSGSPVGRVVGSSPRSAGAKAAAWPSQNTMSTRVLPLRLNPK